MAKPGKGITKSVWDAADALKAANGHPPLRGAVAALVPTVNESTVTTQYGKWCRFYGYVGDNSPSKHQPVDPNPKPTDPVKVPKGKKKSEAYQAGYEGLKKALVGEAVVNPYSPGSKELDEFTAGWNQSHADGIAAAAAAPNVDPTPAA